LFALFSRLQRLNAGNDANFIIIIIFLSIGEKLKAKTKTKSRLAVYMIESAEVRNLETFKKLAMIFNEQGKQIFQYLTDKNKAKK